MEPVLIFVAGAIVVLAVVVGSYYAKQQRRQRFAMAARQLGLEFSPSDPFGLLGWPFALFERGDGQSIENVMWGEWQTVSVKAFDFWYYEESSSSNGGRSKSYYRFDCAMVPIEAACPHLSIGHENLLTRLADALSLHDIELESEDFNRAFNVVGKDRAFATAFIDARMMNWLMLHGETYSFEVVGDQLLVSCKRLRPTELVPLLGTAKAFRDRVPAVVGSLYPKSDPG
jgi:hypothetical protein